MRRHQIWRVMATARPLLIIVVIVISNVLFFRRVMPTARQVAASCAETRMTEVINQCVKSLIDENGYDFSQIARLSAGDGGQIASISVDSTLVNSIKSDLQLKINSRLCGNDSVQIELPLGTLIGNALLFQRYPNLKFNIFFCDTLLTDISSLFESAGINQTIHRAVLTVTANIEIIGLGVDEKRVIKTDFLLCETVIVGAVPSAYTEVIQAGNDSLAGLINDYGANN